MTLTNKICPEIGKFLSSGFKLKLIAEALLHHLLVKGIVINEMKRRYGLDDVNFTPADEE